MFCPETDGQPGRRYGVNLSPWDREGRFLPAPVPLTCLRPQCLPARRHQRHRGGTSPVPVCPGSVSYIYSPGGRTGLGTVPAHWMRQGRALASCFPCPFWGTSPSCSRFVLWLESHSAAQAGLERTAPSCLSLPSDCWEHGPAHHARFPLFYFVLFFRQSEPPVFALEAAPRTPRVEPETGAPRCRLLQRQLWEEDVGVHSVLGSGTAGGTSGSLSRGRDAQPARLSPPWAVPGYRPRGDR